MLLREAGARFVVLLASLGLWVCFVMDRFGIHIEGMDASGSSTAGDFARGRIGSSVVCSICSTGTMEGHLEKGIY